MEQITVLNNETSERQAFFFNLGEPLSQIRSALTEDGIMQSDNSFLTNGGVDLSQSQEKDRSLGDLLGSERTLVIGHHREVLLDEEVTKDIRNMSLPDQITYFDQRGLFRGIIFKETAVEKGVDNIATWDMPEVKITQATPVTKKRTEATYTEVGKSMKETGVIAASVSLDTPFGGGEAGYKSQKERSSSSSSIEQFMVSKFVVQKMLVSIDLEDIHLANEFETAVSEALERHEDNELNFYASLLKILDRWGYYVPAGMMMGGMLYATETASVSSYEESQSESTEFSAAVKAKFKGFGGGAEFSKADGKETSENQTTKYEVDEFTQVGGIRTAVAGTGSGDFRIWSDALTNPVNWDVIEYTRMVPSIALLKSTHLAKTCARIIADNATQLSIRNVQKVLDMYNYAREIKNITYRNGNGI